MDAKVTTTGVARRLSVFAVCMLLLGSGCYHGALFTQYQRFGMQAKADPKTGIPVKLSVGYVHGTVAVVPKEDIDSAPPKGEIGSMIAENEIVASFPKIQKMVLAGQDVLKQRESDRDKWRDRFETLALLANPETAAAINAWKQKDTEEENSETANAQSQFQSAFDDANGTGGQRLLNAKSYFIGGAAAVVATVPQGKMVTIKQNSATTMAIEAKGSSAARVAAAMKKDLKSIEEISKTYYDIETLDESVQASAYELAAQFIGEDTFTDADGKKCTFLNIYNYKRETFSLSQEEAFTTTLAAFLSDHSPGQGPRQDHALAAVRAAWERYQPKEDCK